MVALSLVQDLGQHGGHCLPALDTNMVLLWWPGCPGGKLFFLCLSWVSSGVNCSGVSVCHTEEFTLNHVGAYQGGVTFILTPVKHYCK